MLIKIFFCIKQILSKHPHLKWLFYPLYRGIGMIYSSQIPIKCNLGRQLTFMHGLYGIFIAGGATIGDKVTFYQHVTIGGVNTDSKNQGAPRIGDGCVLYPGCKIVGNVVVGKNCVIGPNVVIWFDIPDNTTVLFEKKCFRLI